VAKLGDDAPPPHLHKAESDAAALPRAIVLRGGVVEVAAAAQTDLYLEDIAAPGWRHRRFRWKVMVLGWPQCGFGSLSTRCETRQRRRRAGL
jgi:hypothetical protein